jgi:mRNA interferase MazF
MVKQYDVFWVNLDPTIDHEIKKARPCVVVSPDDLNMNLGTVLAAPLTSTIKSYAFRVKCHISGKSGEIALDQIRCIDKIRLAKKISHLNNTEISSIKKTLEEMLVK